MNVTNKSELLGKRIDCLDKGFVRLIDVMGDDAAIVQAARVSYGDGTKTINEDRGLIRYLMRQRHTSPFEMVEFKFHIKLPIFVARQWVRHRTANLNEYSGRYSEMRDEFYIPVPDQIRPQNKSNKQGRESQPIPPEIARKVTIEYEKTQTRLYEEYRSFLDKDIARELARINLPLSMYTEWYWKIDLHNLFHFLRLRLDEHAQYEIRVYAAIMADIVKYFVPLAYEAFEDYNLGSVSFSKHELKVLKNMLIIQKPGDELFSDAGISIGEKREFIEKIEKILNLT